MKIAVKIIHHWPEFNEFVRSRTREWVYRGQTRDWPLKTSLERVCDNWEVGFAERPAVERQIIRDFKRRYRGREENRVDEDMLYCLSLMQHHGAPTRLLDFTYSPFVAAKFALETGARDGVVWCLNTTWCWSRAYKIVGKALKDRSVDAPRSDKSFLPLYMDAKMLHKFITAENPMRLNERLVIQQGVFMCPGFTGDSFEENLKTMEGWHLGDNVIKVQFDLDRREVAHFVAVLHRMNVNSAVLFPGLDGFARSLAEGLPLYLDLARREIGSKSFKVGPRRRETSQAHFFL